MEKKNIFTDSNNNNNNNNTTKKPRQKKHKESELVASGLIQRGPLLITRQGISGPAVLKLSAFGARIMSAAKYK